MSGEYTDDTNLPQCTNCGVKQPFLNRLNPQIEVVNFICNECDYQQTRIVGTDTHRSEETND